jgi:hypothetical protein
MLLLAPEVGTNVGFCPVGERSTDTGGGAGVTDGAGELLELNPATPAPHSRQNLAPGTIGFPQFGQNMNPPTLVSRRFRFLAERKGYYGDSVLR